MVPKQDLMDLLTSQRGKSDWATEDHIVNDPFERIASMLTLQWRAMDPEESVTPWSRIFRSPICHCSY